MKASTVPTFLEALAQQFAAKYGSDAVSFLEKAAVAGIEALAEKFDIVVKPAI